MFKKKYAKITIERDFALQFVEACYPMDPDEVITDLIQSVIDGKHKVGGGKND